MYRSSKPLNYFLITDKAQNKKNHSKNLQLYIHEGIACSFLSIQRVQWGREKWHINLFYETQTQLHGRMPRFHGQQIEEFHLWPSSFHWISWSAYSSVEPGHATPYKFRNAHNAHSISILMDLLLLFFLFSFFDFSLPRLRSTNEILRIPLPLNSNEINFIWTCETESNTKDLLYEMNTIREKSNFIFSS